MRTFDYDIMKVIKDRWSPRAFSDDEVKEEDLLAILEAARYAPSCFNEQPWRFIIGKGNTLKLLQKTLMPRNLMWAGKAPVLILIACKTTFDHNGKVNSYAEYDTGTAWGFLSLEATKRGLYTHAMAGFNKDVAKDILELDDSIEPIAMIAVGYPGDVNHLNEMFIDMEKPNTRKSIKELIIEVKE